MHHISLANSDQNWACTTSLANSHQSWAHATPLANCDQSWAHATPLANSYQSWARATYLANNDQSWACVTPFAKSDRSWAAVGMRHIFKLIIILKVKTIAGRQLLIYNSLGCHTFDSCCHRSSKRLKSAKNVCHLIDLPTF